MAPDTEVSSENQTQRLPLLHNSSKEKQNANTALNKKSQNQENMTSDLADSSDKMSDSGESGQSTRRKRGRPRKVLSESETPKNSSSSANVNKKLNHNYIL